MTGFVPVTIFIFITKGNMMSFSTFSRQSRTRPSLIRLALLLGCSLIAVPCAHAQDDGVGLGEIVVTAQKRSENVQKTPIAMNVVGGEKLADAGITDIKGLTRLAPDLDFVGDSVYTKLSVRGISAQDTSLASDSALTINIDGEYINRPTGLNAAFFDLERVELLRGPQGTLYGRNSTAGALNIIAKKPDQELGGFASISYGNYDSLTAQAAFNMPVTDRLAVRVAGMHSEHGGYYNKAGNGNSDAARLGIAWEATPDIKAYVAAEYVNMNSNSSAIYGVQVNGTTNPELVGEQPSTIDFSIPDTWAMGSYGFIRQEQYAFRGRLDIALGFADLAYVGGYRHSDLSALNPLNGYAPTTFAMAIPKMNSETQSHELRLSHEYDNGIFWQAGAFYFREDQDVEQGLQLPLVNNAYVNYYYRPDVKAESVSGFGQVTVPLADTLKFTGGLRYTDDRKSGTFYNFSGFMFTKPSMDAASATVLDRKAHSSQLTWSAGLDWQATPDNLLYAKVSTGFKAGGFDTTGAYDPEKLTAYEIGAKNRFMDDAVQLNLAAFYYDYTDQQVAVLISTAQGSATVNAGKSRIWGVESDLTVKLSANDTFTMAVNYLNAKFTRFETVAATVAAGNINADLTGNAPPQSPRITLALGYDHVFHIGDGQLKASAYSRFKSEYYLTAFNYRADRQAAYTQTDLMLEYSAPGKRWSVQGFVRNLEDERVKVSSSFTGDTVGIYSWQLGTPRTYGAQISYKF